MSAPAPLTALVTGLDGLLAGTTDEVGILRGGRRLLERLVSQDDWLPEAYAAPSADRYRQYLLYRDPQARFSVVSFVWGPGQSTPIHDHTVWGLVGVLRGAELSQRFTLDITGPAALGPPERLEPGSVEALSPRLGDIHRVANAYGDRVSVSIHVYGADIGAVRRWSYPRLGERNAFISGYDNTEANPPFSLEPERAHS